jgi:hypothetical protein
VSQDTMYPIKGGFSGQFHLIIFVHSCGYAKIF